MHEPDVTLTDYGLALECALLALLLGRTPAGRNGLRRAGICFFVCLGLSAATGGTVHGFCPDPNSPAYRAFWQATLQLIGLAACSMWVLGAGVLTSGRTPRWLMLAPFSALVLYIPSAFLMTQEFWIALMIYLPAALLLLAGFCRAAWRGGNRAAFVGASGSVLSLLSSFIQFMRIGIDPVYFNHNALAHVVQALALGLMWVGIRHVADPTVLEDRARSCTLENPN